MEHYDDADMADGKLVSWAEQFLNRKHDQPFFLGVGFFRPHMPWQVPRKYYNMYPPEKITLPTVLKDDLNDLPPAGVKMARPQGDHATMTPSNNSYSFFINKLKIINHPVTCCKNIFIL